MAKINETNREKLTRLLKTERPDKQPRISIYMPTHRRPPDRDTDPIRFKNLLQDAEKKLEKSYPKRHWEVALNALYQLVEETSFWTYTADGVAVFASGKELEIFHLQYSPDPVVLVGDRFHVITLLAYLERLDEAILAEIGRDRVNLYRVNRYDHDPLVTDKVETSFYNIFDDLDPYSSLTAGAGGGGTVLHGYRTTPDEVERDRDKYFRYLADAFTLMHKKEKKPILLAGTVSSLAEFRKVAKGDFYLETQIEKPLDSMDPQGIQKAIAEAIEPLYSSAIDHIHQRIMRAKQNEMLATRADVIEKMAAEGRIGELIIDLSRLRPDDITLDHAIGLALQSGTEITVLQDKAHDLESLYSAILRF